ncbi:MADCA protein, partial [Chordeiles acutipennis]|nr:MADCA protein [Chordeiles acutipennis]
LSLNPTASSFLRPGRPVNKLAVMPREPVVRYGGSAELNCSLACTGGTVQWKGLDTNLGSITSFPTHSILHVSNAVVAMGGTRICQGTCHGQHYQQTVDLKVYALPDWLELEAEPRALVPGQPASLRCSAQRVYPLTGLLLTWHWGDRVLEDTEFDVTETEEELFDIVSTLLVAGEQVGEGVEFRCEVTLSIGQETFTQVASVAVSAAGDTAEPVTTTALPPELSVPTRDPSTALTTPPWEPDAVTILEPAAATKPPSTELPAPRDPVAGSPTARPATTTLPGSGTTSPGAEARGTAGDNLGRGSPWAEKGTEPSVGTAAPCSLQIRSLPPDGTRGRALRIECRARCPGNATVRWLRTPVALAQYREETAGSSSTLRLDRAEPQHQGHYQCILLGHRSQVVSLQLRVLDDPLSPGPAIATGTTASLLGLIVAAVVSHRLWKRCRAEYELP